MADTPITPRQDLCKCIPRVVRARTSKARRRVLSEAEPARVPHPSRLRTAAARALIPHIKISLTTKHAWSTLSARLRQRSRKEQGYGFLSFRDGDSRRHARRLEYHAPRHSCGCCIGCCRCRGAETGLRWRAAG